MKKKMFRSLSLSITRSFSFSLALIDGTISTIIIGHADSSARAFLPLLLVFVHRDTAGAERYDHQQSPDHGQRLEEVVLQKVP